MKIGIIGAGAIGTAIAKALARAGIDAVIANSRGPQSLLPLTQELGRHITAGTVMEAAAADLVFVAVNWSNLPAALREVSDWNGRIVIDANNPIESPAFKPFDLGGRTSSEVVSELVRGARLVKAFNHLAPALLSADPAAEGGRRALFYAGEDSNAKKTVAELIERLGFFGIDLGSLASGGRLSQFPGGPLPALNLVKFD